MNNVVSFPVRPGTPLHTWAEAYNILRENKGEEVAINGLLLNHVPNTHLRRATQQVAADMREEEGEDVQV